MSYKNTMKLFASNFTLVWKQLLYLVCILFIFSVCSYTIATPVLDLLKNNGIVEDIKLMFNSVYETPSEFALVLVTAQSIFLESWLTTFQASGSTWSEQLCSAYFCHLCLFKCQSTTFRQSCIKSSQWTWTQTIHKTPLEHSNTHLDMLLQTLF